MQQIKRNTFVHHKNKSKGISTIESQNTTSQTKNSWGIIKCRKSNGILTNEIITYNKSLFVFPLVWQPPKGQELGTEAAAATSKERDSTLREQGLGTEAAAAAPEVRNNAREGQELGTETAAMTSKGRCSDRKGRPHHGPERFLKKKHG